MATEQRPLAESEVLTGTPGTGHKKGSGWTKVKRHINEETERKQKTKAKWIKLTDDMKIGVANFFGVAEESTLDKRKAIAKWQDRSRQLYATNRLFGGFTASASTRSDPILETEERQDIMQPDKDVVDTGFLKSKRMRRFQPASNFIKPNVFHMTAKGIRNILGGKPYQKISPRSRSFKPTDIALGRPRGRFVLEKDDFFGPPYSTSPLTTISTSRPARKKAYYASGGDVPDSAKGVKKALEDFGSQTTKLLKGGFAIKAREDIRVTGDMDETDSVVMGRMKRMTDNFIEDIVDNTNRRELGVGVVGKLLDWEQNSYLATRDPEVGRQLEKLAADQHRPYFTYWVTFVQIVCYIIAIAVYGLAPIGISETRIEAEVLQPSLSIEIVHYVEADNLWIGPRQADLIHLGAKYSPCMRNDTNVAQAIAEDRLKESKTACCIKNDGSGCVQAPERLCSGTLSTWWKWGVKNITGISNRNYRMSGSVCGQDPKYCKNPVSLPPYEWPDDISQWPICTESSPASMGDNDKHMKCEILGRPCCVGIQGQCIITTREFCEFRRGYFHEEATLCSQISCMSEICGMIPFYNPDKPNQFYRLWTSLFIHAGLLQLVITVLFQWFIMRDVEKLAGWIRIAVIYIMSGIGGSLASAIFIPYHVEAGPSGSQFGILACLFVEVIQNWQLISNPCWAVGKLTFILVCLFVLGLLPMIDNWAHLFGFIFGFLLAFALLPYVTFNMKDRQCKLIGIIICLVASFGMFFFLLLLFYVIPIYRCPRCEYFNCIPFTPTFCRSMEVKITRNDEF